MRPTTLIDTFSGDRDFSMEMLDLTWKYPGTNIEPTACTKPVDESTKEAMKFYNELYRHRAGIEQD